MASTSSMTTTRRPRGRCRRRGSPAWPCRTRALYFSRRTGGGSLPPLRTASTPVPSPVATAAPSRKPRASMPATRSAPAATSASASVTAAEAVPVGEHRRQVLELDAGFREVGHLTGQRCDQIRRCRCSSARRRSLPQHPPVHVPARTPAGRIAAHRRHLLRRQQCALLPVQRQRRHVGPQHGAPSPSSRACSFGSTVTASAPMMPSIWPLA